MTNESRKSFCLICGTDIKFPAKACDDHQEQYQRHRKKNYQYQYYLKVTKPKRKDQHGKKH